MAPSHVNDRICAHDQVVVEGELSLCHMDLKCNVLWILHAVPVTEALNIPTSEDRLLILKFTLLTSCGGRYYCKYMK